MSTETKYVAGTLSLAGKSDVSLQLIFRKLFGQNILTRQMFSSYNALSIQQQRQVCPYCFMVTTAA